ncbi:hypothetical protein MMC21_006136 [Puttea exsequens]|nr:hypothetical protein [Puttea exsequens]
MQINAQLCSTCGVDLCQNLDLRRRNSILQRQYDIVSAELVRAGQYIQIKELEIEKLKSDRHGWIEVVESFKRAATGLQNFLEGQEATFRAKTAECAQAVQSLGHETNLRERLEKDLARERATFQALFDCMGKTIPQQQNALQGESWRRDTGPQYQPNQSRGHAANVSAQSQSKSETSFSESE